MDRLELSTTALWEQLSTIEIHQNISGQVRTRTFITWISVKLPDQLEDMPIFFFADSIGIEPITLVLETNVLPLNYEPILAVGSGFAPLVSPISMEWDYYFSNLQNTKSLITSPYCTQRTFRNDGIKYCKLLDWTSCKSSCGEGRTRTYSLLINSQ